MIPTLVTPEGRELETDQEKADAFAELYQSFHGVGEKEEDLPRIPKEETPITALTSSFEISNIIKRLKGKKATGLDQLGARLIKPCTASLANPLKAIVNKALTDQKVPSNWKTGRIAPIPKITCPARPADYRPITITTTLAKVFDRLLTQRLNSEIGSRISPVQFAYSRKSGVADAIVALQTEVVQRAQVCPSAVRVVLCALDCSRAFNAISHTAILSGLTDLGAPMWLASLVKDFIRDRTEIAMVGDAQAMPYTPLAGIPAGTALGPLAFIAGLDSVFSLPLSEGTYIQGFADDLIVVKALSKDEKEKDEANLREDLNIIAAHLKSKGLRLNGEKSQCLVVEFTRSEPITPPLSINGEQIKQVETMRYLGATLDRKLDFCANWDRVASNAKKLVGAIGRLVHGERRILRHMFRERVFSIINFHLASHPPSQEKSWTKLNSVYTYAASLITNKWYKRGTRSKEEKEKCLKEARLEPASQMAVKAALRLFFNSLVRGGRYGRWIKLAAGQSTSRRADYARFRVLPPKTRSINWDKLLPIRGAKLWNTVLDLLKEELTSMPVQPPIKAGEWRKEPKKFTKTLLDRIFAAIDGLPQSKNDVKKSFNLPYTG